MSKRTLARLALILAAVLVLAAFSAVTTAAAPAAAPAFSVQGFAGPDAGGYMYEDITYDFEDISGSGTRPDYSGGGGYLDTEDDNISEPLDVGFSFNFYGVDYDTAYVTSNGYLTFDVDAYNNGENGCCTGGVFPSPDDGNNTANAIIAGWWTDLDPGDGGEIYFETLGSAPNRRFIVQFEDVETYDTGEPIRWEIVLYETSNNIEVHYDYVASQDDDYYNQAAGIENEDGTIGLTYWSGVAALPDQTAVRYTPGNTPATPACDPDLVGAATNQGTDTSYLFEIDPTNGFPTVIGEVEAPYTYLSDLAWASDGTLYGIAWNGSDNPALVEINPCDGSVDSEVGELDTNARTYTDMAFDSSDNLYAVKKPDSNTQRLVMIDTSDASETDIGSIDCETCYGNALSFDGSGDLIFFDGEDIQGDAGYRYSVDTSDASLSNMASLTYVPDPINYDPRHTEADYSSYLDLMYGTLFDGYLYEGEGNDTYLTVIRGGWVDVVGPTVGGLNALAFNPDGTPEAPNLPDHAKEEVTPEAPGPDYSIEGTGTATGNAVHWDWEVCNLMEGASPGLSVRFDAESTLTFDSSVPAGTVDGNTLWVSLDPLQPGECAPITIETTYNGSSADLSGSLRARAVRSAAEQGTLVCMDGSVADASSRACAAVGGAAAAPAEEFPTTLPETGGSPVGQASWLLWGALVAALLAGAALVGLVARKRLA